MAAREAAMSLRRALSGLYSHKAAVAGSPRLHSVIRPAAVFQTRFSAHDAHHEHVEQEKMVGEGGASHSQTPSSLHPDDEADSEHAQAAKETLQSHVDKAKGASGISEQMQVAKETTMELGEVGKEAAKSVQRDALKMGGAVAEKTKESASVTADTTSQLKDVGVELGKSLARDASTLGSKVADSTKETAAWTADTAQQLKEVGVEAGKSVVRDTKIVTEKVTGSSQK